MPWLESLHALADVPPPSAFPKRFGIVFLGCVVNEDHWSAEGQGADMKLSKTLSPLEPVKEKINVIDGLYVHALTGQGIHPAQTGSLLSGAHFRKAPHPLRHQHRPDDSQPRGLTASRTFWRVQTLTNLAAPPWRSAWFRDAVYWRPNMAQTVSTTNQRIDSLVKTAQGLAALGVGWLAWVSVALFNMHGDISAIKQAEKNNGTEIVNRLEKPPSIDQLKHDLEVTSARLELQKLTINPKTKVEPSSFKGLDAALLQVTKSHPDLPQAWNAAAKLVSYKSATSTTTPTAPPPCDVSHMKVEQRVNTTPDRVVHVMWGTSLRTAP